jgi:hypothetical protein
VSVGQKKSSALLPFPSCRTTLVQLKVSQMKCSCKYVAATTFLLLGIVPAASARDYYVSPTGNDHNLGTTAANPWKTIAKVNSSTLSPGDRVLFQAGKTFAGQVYLAPQDRGTAALPIIVGSYGTGRATINAGTGGGILVYDTSGIRIENLSVVGAGRAHHNLSDGISFYTDIALPGNKLDTIQVDNVEVSGFGKNGVVLGGYAYDQIHHVGIKTGFKNVRFTNISAHDNADAGISTYGSFDSFSTSTAYAHGNVYVGNCRAYNNVGIQGKGANSGNGIVLSDVQSGLIEHCVAYNNGQNNNHLGGPIGIWVWECDAITIQFCESYANKSRTNDGGGFDIDGGCSNCVLQNNYSHDNVGSGFLVYQFVGARPQKNNVVQNNVSVNDGRTNGGGLAIGGGATNSYFYGNQVTVGPRAAGAPAGVYAAGVVVDGYKNTNTIFRNNQFNTQGSAALVGVIDLTEQNGIHFTGNSYNAAVNSFSIIWGTRNFTSLSTWRTATGQEP